MNEEFAIKMSAELGDADTQRDTMDELNSKIVESIIKGFIESKFKSSIQIFEIIKTE